MPHYKSGMEAKIGDIVIGKDWGGNAIAGEVIAIYPSDSCNMLLATIVNQKAIVQSTMNCKDFQLAARDGEPIAGGVMIQ